MRLKAPTEETHDPTKWEKWFAWYPVTVDGTGTVAFMETIERRCHYTEGDGAVCYYRYHN